MSEKRPVMLAERLNAGDVFEPRCRARTVLKHMTSTWAVLALIALRPGTLRFSQLRRKVNGVSERMLAQTLQHLVGDGLVTRHSHNVVPPHVDYALTELGHEAAKLIEALTDWVEGHMSDFTEE